MPTTRLRHQITETEEIEAALDLGSREWPLLSRSDVLRALVLRGAESLHLTLAERVMATELAMHQLTELGIDYPSNYLASIRSA
jgi:hypothetical protein